MAIVRIPTSLVFVIIQPIMFVLLFRYIFARRHPGRHSGRLRQLPDSGHPGPDDDLRRRQHRHRPRRGPPARTHRAFQGPADGANGRARRAHPGRHRAQRGDPHHHHRGGHRGRLSPARWFFPYIGASVVMLIFAYCLSWGFAFVGLAAPNSETAQAMTFPLIFPLTFASTIFVPSARCPAGSRDSRATNRSARPTDAVRGLCSGPPTGSRCGSRSLGRLVSCRARAARVSTASAGPPRPWPSSTPAQLQQILDVAFPGRDVPTVEAVDDAGSWSRLHVDDLHGRPGGTLSGTSDDDARRHGGVGGDHGPGRSGPARGHHESAHRLPAQAPSSPTCWRAPGSSSSVGNLAV